MDDLSTSLSGSRRGRRRRPRSGALPRSLAILVIPCLLTFGVVLQTGYSTSQERQLIDYEWLNVPSMPTVVQTYSSTVETLSSELLNATSAMASDASEVLSDLADLMVSSNHEEENLSVSFSYVRSFTNLQRQVLFEHIPKVAGTTIEFAVAAKQGNLTWGCCRYQDYPGCPSEPNKPFRYAGVPNFPFWHIPASFFPLAGASTHDADLFVVLREPEDRLLSEIFYWCRLKRRKKCHEPATLNRLVRQHLQQSHPTASNNTTMPPIQAYFHQVGHYIPQWDYVMGLSSEFPVRRVDHVLYLDNVKEQFGQLANAYQLPLQWPDKKENAGASPTHDDVPQLQSDVLSLIRDVYARDFAAFYSNDNTTATVATA